MRILVLDGNENQAVAAVRSLSRAGHTVLVGAATRWSKAGWSRHGSGTFIYPAPEEDAEVFVRDIARWTAAEPGTQVLPMTERTTLPISARRELILGAGGRLVLPSHEAVLRAFDKAATTALAGRLGLAVPASRLVGDPAELEGILAALAFPLVLKARRSETVQRTGGVRSGGPPRYAKNPEQLRAAYAAIRRNADEVLVQEFIPGDGAGYFALFQQGQPVAEFGHRRIRDVRPTGSGSALRVSARPTEEMLQAGRAMLRELTWHGVAMVEFRVGPGGRLYFLEVNGRFWNSLALAVCAGMDFPARLAELAEHGEVRGSVEYREGVRCRWLLGDLRHLVEVWRGPPAGYPQRYPSRWKTLAQFLRPHRATFHDNFQWDDPLPELGDWLDFVIRRFPKYWNSDG